MLLTEMMIFNIVRAYLVRERYVTLQLVSPGGQAPFGLSVVTNGKKSTKYPDMITMKDDIIFVGEIKPGFSRSDKEKLELIIGTASLQLRDLVSRYFNLDTKSSRICPVLCHSNVIHPVIPHFEQWIAKVDGSICVNKMMDGR